MLDCLIRISPIFFATIFVTVVNALDRSPEPGEFATSYVDSSGSRITDAYAAGHSGAAADIELFRVAAQNNLCVTLLRAQKIGNAMQACERAAALGNDYFRAGDPERSPSSAAALLATVNSNLGVVHALSGNYATAESKFSEASRLDARLVAASDNLSILRSYMPAYAALASD